MDLKQNIVDSVKECEIKLGYRAEAISLYYPEKVLLELLNVPKGNLEEEINNFCDLVLGELGKIQIIQTQERERYQIIIPKEGVMFIHENVEASPFVKEFVQEIHRPGMTKEAVIALFRRYSEEVVTEQAEEKEWAIYFADPKIDAYVYYMEEDDFGLQYHRFTRKSYEAIRNK